MSAHLNLAKEGILYFCKENISERWNTDLDAWLLLECNNELFTVYRTTFRHNFRIMNESLKNILAVCAANTTVAIRSIKHGTPKKEEVLRFVELFLSEQMREFEYLCVQCGVDLYEGIVKFT